ncbi:MAG: 2-dehydropantoate 2-reductase N-terminal domain-containing protein [Acidimicrobiales bacterium]
MRFVVVGAGAVGGVVGGRLAQYDHDVALVARGDHGEAIAADGLLIRSPDGEVRVSVPVVSHPSELTLTDDDVVLLAVKGQDTAAALEGLAAGPADVAVACLQNGVDNERQVLRRTANTYAVPVMLPGTYLEPGVVEASSAPISGILDIGRYPTGIDERAAAISAAFATSTFSSRPEPHVMRFKWSKLLMNLGNALEAAIGPIGRDSQLYPMARAEAEAVLAAAGIDCASIEEDSKRRGDLIGMRRIDGRRREGGSTWQSLARGTGRVETDLLNGEIVLLGRLHGVETPVNALLQRVANELARDHAPPACMTEAELLAQLA